MNYIGEDGSLMMPTFTYNFKRTNNQEAYFSKSGSTSLVGALSETFRKMDGVIRTSSATHSFALWGACKEIGEGNNPISPLGVESPLEWLTKNNGSILIIGADFASMSYIHYLEILYNLPWINSFCWNKNNVLPIGVSEGSVTNLIQVPGCSRGFKSLFNYLYNKELIAFNEFNNLSYLLINCHDLINISSDFLKFSYRELLCENEDSHCCNFRRQLKKVK